MFLEEMLPECKTFVRINLQPHVTHVLASNSTCLMSQKPPLKYSSMVAKASTFNSSDLVHMGFGFGPSSVSETSIEGLSGMGHWIQLIPPLNRFRIVSTLSHCFASSPAIASETQRHRNPKRAKRPLKPDSMWIEKGSAKRGDRHINDLYKLYNIYMKVFQRKCSPILFTELPPSAACCRTTSQIDVARALKMEKQGPAYLSLTRGFSEAEVHQTFGLNHVKSPWGYALWRWFSISYFYPWTAYQKIT